jgi:hypothetical protein
VAGCIGPGPTTEPAFVGISVLLAATSATFRSAAIEESVFSAVAGTGLIAMSGQGAPGSLETFASGRSMPISAALPIEGGEDT